MASTSPSSSSAPVVAMRRLGRELETLQRSQQEMIAVQPSEENLLEWHFVLHSLPSDTPYHGGCYHGKILFPPEYPHAPPSILMVTPSGRMEVGKRLCLSMTDFHPESWNPAWSVETILVGLLSFFISDAEKGYGAISSSAERRRQFAAESHGFNAADSVFNALFPRFLSSGGSRPSTETEPKEIAAIVTGATEESTDAVDSDLQVGPTRSEETTTSGTVTPIMTADLVPNSEERDQWRHEIEARAVEMARGDQPIAESNIPLMAQGDRLGEGDPDDHRRSAPHANVNAGSAQTTEDEDETAMECWICRDVIPGEPLINPCACRGSMSGVHASCVEQWIRHHRRNAVNDEAPRCSVCHQPYTGSERRPGVGLFARHLCYDASHQLLRTVCLVLLLVAYQMGASETTKDMNWSLWPFVRVLLVLLFTVVAMHKAAVLTVSLPPHRPPPRNRHLQRFFVRDYRQLAMHIAETFASITILGIWCLDGTLKWPFFVPFVLLALTPAVKFCVRGSPSIECVQNACRTCIRIILAPFFILGLMVNYVRNNPRRGIMFIANPLDGGPHMIVALVTAILCLACASNVSVIILWGLHGLLAGAGLIEIHFVKHLKWEEGNKWWLALQLTAFTAYMANTLCEFPQGFGQSDDKDLTSSRLIVLSVSMLWFFSVCGLGLSCNWALCVRHYRTWQHRHGTFTLEHTPAGRDASSNV